MDKNYTPDYWSSTHIGYNFGENNISLAAELPFSIIEEDGYQNLKCECLLEVIEGKTSDDFSSHIIRLEEDKPFEKVGSIFNPLVLNIKQEEIDEKQPTVEATVKRINLGQDYSLQPFKEKESKIELLKMAILSHDGNAILSVILFLRKTLKKTLFQREITMRPDAANVYLAHLEENHEYDDLVNMFLLLGNPDAAAMVKYCSILSLQHLDTKIKKISNSLTAYFQPDIVDEFLCSSVLEHKQLICHQIAIEKHYSVICSNETDKFKCYQLLTHENSITDTSAISTLVFCCLLFYHASEICYLSPLYLITTFGMSKKQFTWSAIRALLATERWSEVEKLFTCKGWLGNTKIKSCINFSRLIKVLADMKAPCDFISKFLPSIENQGLKLILAKKYKIHSVVIEIIKNNRDRKELLDYIKTLPPHSTEFCLAADILNNEAVKWRN